MPIQALTLFLIYFCVCLDTLLDLNIDIKFKNVKLERRGRHAHQEEAREDDESQRDRHRRLHGHAQRAQEAEHRPSDPQKHGHRRRAQQSAPQLQLGRPGHPGQESAQELEEARRRGVDQQRRGQHQRLLAQLELERLVVQAANVAESERQAELSSREQQRGIGEAREQRLARSGAAKAGGAARK